METEDGDNWVGLTRGAGSGRTDDRPLHLGLGLGSEFTSEEFPGSLTPLMSPEASKQVVDYRRQERRRVLTAASCPRHDLFELRVADRSRVLLLGAHRDPIGRYAGSAMRSMTRSGGSTTGLSPEGIVYDHAGPGSSLSHSCVIAVSAFSPTCALVRARLQVFGHSSGTVWPSQSRFMVGRAGLGRRAARGGALSQTAIFVDCRHRRADPPAEASSRRLEATAVRLRCPDSLDKALDLLAEHARVPGSSRWWPEPCVSVAFRLARLSCLSTSTALCGPG